MDIPTLLISLLLGFGALTLVFYPLWQQTRQTTSVDHTTTKQAEAELRLRYEATLATIRDLMLDHEMEKVSTEDYEPLLYKAKVEAAQIRQKMDQLQAQRSAPAIDPTLDEQLEVMIAKARAEQGPPSAGIEAEIVALTQISAREKTEGGQTCPSCQTAVSSDDLFCRTCGQRLAEETPAEEPGGFCPQCGQEFIAGDAFCTKCGFHLVSEAEAPDEGAA
ncbi:MAG: zinc ribbon domain-containing protein [Chloroflexota bacterium]